MITVTTSGSFDNTERFLRRMSNGDIFNALSGYGEQGRAALAEATPKDTGRASDSWSYEVVKSKGLWQIIWSNTDQENGFPVAIMLQYGHGTGTGGYVQGVDYINPAIKPIFDKIAEAAWREVTRA